MENRYKLRKFDLKRVLKKHGISQYELAKRLGVETNRVTAMIKPNYNPTLKTLNKLAKAIGCCAEDFIL